MLSILRLATIGCMAIALAVSIESTRARRFAELPFFDTFSKMSSLIGRIPDFISKKSGKQRFQEIKKEFTKNSQKASPKVNSATTVLDVCPFSVGGYHVLTSESFIAPEVGALECAKYGWNYGIIPESQWHFAAWAISNCTSLSVGLRSFNGFDIGGCQLMQGAGVFLMTQDAWECANILAFPLLCYEGPLQESTETIFEDITATVTTIVTYTTPGMEKQPIVAHTSSSQKRINKEALAKRRKQVKGRLQDGYDVCPTSYNGYYMIFDFFNHADSYQVCADLGLYLADVDTSNINDMLALFDACQPYDVIFNVNSYGGVSTGLCRLTYFLPWYNVWGLIGVNPNVCYFLDAPIICQSDPFTATATTGTATSTTVYLTYTSTEIVPISTETITQTEYA